ncbi:MAG: TIM barrel protein [Motiliproteus sp.]
MGYQYSLAHLSVLRLSPAEMITVAARTGYDFVSLRMTAVTTTERTFPLMDNPVMMHEAKALLADTGLEVLDIELARLGPDDEPENFQAFLETGAELGARHVICQLPDPDRDRAIERFARLCDMAKPLGLTVDLEFPSWTETPDITETARVLNAVNRSNAGMLIDTLHVDRCRANLDELTTAPRQWFNFIQLCDAAKEIPATEAGLIHTARCDRQFPGDGGLNLQEMLACLPQVPYSLEIPNNKLINQLGAEEYAQRMLVAAKHYLEGDYRQSEREPLSA